MFVSFFPRPKPFFLSLLVWIAVVVGAWYGYFRGLGYDLGIATPSDPDNPVIGPGYFITGEFIWFYIYFAVVTAIFAAVWRVLSPQRWFWWSVLGSALILFITYFQVQVSVAVNNWYGPFYDMIQAALSHSRPVTADDLYGSVASFTGIATVFILVAVFTRFFVSHYIFRWRTAMNDYYLANWPQLRTVEGAAQRVQEDTMRFATIVEDLGVSFVGSVMTLIAFLPVLLRLSKYVTELPVVGAVPEPLVLAAVGWSLFGTLFLALIGVKLPGLEFRNQRAEAAYRKELVFGEDDPGRATPPTLGELFGAVRRNYFRLYFHYMYFNIGRYLYLQADNIFSVFILIPTIAAGAITLGVFQQINNAFDQVRGSFQFLVLSWTTIVTLMSIYQRLRTFESMIEEGVVPSLESRYQARPD